MYKCKANKVFIFSLAQTCFAGSLDSPVLGAVESTTAPTIQVHRNMLVNQGPLCMARNKKYIENKLLNSVENDASFYH
jgi:hypothetical protein